MNTKENNPLKILVICTGNICRSPTGEAVLRAKASELGLNVEVDSAGTIDYHTGSAPDARSRRVGEGRGYDFSDIFARQVQLEDFDKFDMILASDNANLAYLREVCPKEHLHKVSLFMSHLNSDFEEIPDPYFGDKADFNLVVDLIEQASDEILKQV